MHFKIAAQDEVICACNFPLMCPTKFGWENKRHDEMFDNLSKIILYPLYLKPIQHPGLDLIGF